jgi:hypothetical protein
VTDVHSRVSCVPARANDGDVSLSCDGSDEDPDLTTERVTEINGGTIPSSLANDDTQRTFRCFARCGPSCRSRRPVTSTLPGRRSPEKSAVHVQVHYNVLILKASAIGRESSWSSARWERVVQHDAEAGKASAARPCQIFRTTTSILVLLASAQHTLAYSVADTCILPMQLV